MNAARRPVRGILLDKDGTLFDCDLTWSPVIRHLAEEMMPDGDAAALVDAAGLDPATGRFRAGSVWAAGSTGELVRLWWPQASAGEAGKLARRIDGIVAELGPKFAVPLFDLTKLVDELRLRFVLGIATNDSIASLNAFVEAHGLTGLIPHLIGYDTVANPKPAPDMVHLFCAETGLDPAEVAVVGDNVHDLEMARSAGAGWAIGVLSGNGDHGDLSFAADVILPSAASLPEWLQEVS